MNVQSDCSADSWYMIDFGVERQLIQVKVWNLGVAAGSDILRELDDYQIRVGGLRARREMEDRGEQQQTLGLKARRERGFESEERDGRQGRATAYVGVESEEREGG